MEPVLYFRILSIALGALLVLVGTVPMLGLSRHAVIRGGNRGRSPVSSPRQPFLLWLVAVVGLVVVAATWWMQVKHPVAYSLAVTVVAALSVVWASQVLFNYARFRELQRKLAAIRPGLVAAFRVAVALVGVALILLGVFVYR